MPTLTSSALSLKVLGQEGRIRSSFQGKIPYLITPLMKNIKNRQASAIKSLLSHTVGYLAPCSTAGTGLVSVRDLTTEHRGLESIGPSTERVALSRPVQL